MLELYTWTTPNGYKPLILLEELGVGYTVKPVNIGVGEQHAPDYLKINPNAKIPALVDDGQPIFESGAILLYLAEKYGRFLPVNQPGRSMTMEWLMFQMSAIGPMMGQLGHFKGAKRDDPYPLERYTKEVERILRVVDTQLHKYDYLAQEYSIADMASLPWLRGAGRFGFAAANFPAIARYIERVEARPAVKKALAWQP